MAENNTSKPLCLACTRVMRLLLAQPDPVDRKKEERIYECESCKVLNTVIVDY